MDRNQTIIELMEVVNSQEDAIRQMYRENELLAISDNNFNLDDFDFLSSYSAIVPKRLSALGEISHFKYFDEIVFTSEELKYFTAHLFLLKPFIDAPSPAEVNGETIYYFYQNIPGKRYNMYSDICFQKTYNYWDRIGDLIAKFVSEKEPEKVYFGNILNDIKKRKPDRTDILNGCGISDKMNIRP